MGNEITEHHIYLKLAEREKDPKNKEVLSRIAGEELRHYDFGLSYTNEDVPPNKLKILGYVMLATTLGVTFAVKLMEKGEERAQKTYYEIASTIPEAKRIAEEEDEHEKKLLDMLDEERLKYVGSIVLGLNDALVELTGALAGFTFALKDTQLIAVTGLITGVAASLSMAASEYLSTKTGGESKGGKDPLKAAVYTGVAYVLTVVFLILPYFLFKNVYSSLAVMLVNAIIVITAFTFYISVAKDLDFRRRFSEMAGISIGVAALTFAIGFVIQKTTGLDV